jgi:hypothetical protein
MLPTGQKIIIDLRKASTKETINLLDLINSVVKVVNKKKKVKCKLRKQKEEQKNA